MRGRTPPSHLPPVPVTKPLFAFCAHLRQGARDPSYSLASFSDGIASATIRINERLELLSSRLAQEVWSFSQGGLHQYFGSIIWSASSYVAAARP